MSNEEKVFVNHDYTTVVAQMILSEARYIHGCEHVDAEGKRVILNREQVFRDASCRVSLAMDLAREYIEARK